MSFPTKAPVRTGVIGVTGYASIYFDILEILVSEGALQLDAAVIINPEEAAEKVRRLRRMGTRIYDSYQMMLDEQGDNLELCLIPTGIPWHARMTVAALHAGCNVLVEKPLAGSTADADAIRAAEAATGKFVAVGYQDVYLPEAVWLKNQLAGGIIGDLCSIRVLGMWPRPAAYFTRNDWAGKEYANGAAVLDSPVNNAFAHFVHLAFFLADPHLFQNQRILPQSAELFRFHRIESYDTAAIRAVGGDGLSFWFGFSHSCHRTREPEIRLEGSHGRAEWRHEDRCLIIHEGGRTVEKFLPDTHAARRIMFSTVLARLEDPSIPIAGTAMAAHHTAFVEDVHRFSPVIEADDSLARWEETPAGLFPRADGLDDALERAFQTGSLLKEAGFPRDAVSSSKPSRK